MKTLAIDPRLISSLCDRKTDRCKLLLFNRYVQYAARFTHTLNVLNRQRNRQLNVLRKSGLRATTVAYKKISIHIIVTAIRYGVTLQVCTHLTAHVWLS